MKIRIKKNIEHDMTLEEFMNMEYGMYVSCPNSELSNKAIELKESWEIILSRLELYGVIEIDRDINFDDIDFKNIDYTKYSKEINEMKELVEKIRGDKKLMKKLKKFKSKNHPHDTGGI